MTSPNVATVLKFVKAWEARDLEAIVSGFAPDAVYHNLPTDPVVGHEQIRATVKPWIDASTHMAWTIHNIAETASGVVMAERTDELVMNGKPAALRVTGVFEIKDGLITAWRDYYDQASFARQMSGD